MTQAEVYTIIVAVRPALPTPNDLVPGHEFLLVQNVRRGGRWELPGGRCQSGETSVECATREFLEETGRRIVDPQEIQQRTSRFGHGHVYLARCGPVERPPLLDEIRATRFSRELPGRHDLSFPDDPYGEVFAAARRALGLATPPGPDPAHP